MTLDIRPFDTALGAEVRGVDLARPLDTETFTAIEQAYDSNSVLLFRDQSIDEAQHLAFSRRFGELEVHVLDQYLHQEHPEILIVSNVMDGDRHVGIYDAGRYWHTDLSYMAVPSRRLVALRHRGAARRVGGAFGRYPVRQYRSRVRRSCLRA